MLRRRRSTPTVTNMHRSRLSVILGSLALTVAACGGSPALTTEAPVESDPPPKNAEAHNTAPYVVLVSFDAFRWDYQDQYATPNFDRVTAAGVRAERMTPVFPTKTFPSHYAIATGMYAEKHGLVGNTFWAQDKQAWYTIGNRAAVEDGGFYRGEPIWVTAEQQGMIAASLFFVGSEAPVGGVRPTYWNRFDASIPNDTRVDQVLTWLGMPLENRPHMITLYFEDVDDAGHDFGPGSAEVGDAVAAVDANLGRLLDGILALPHADDVFLVLVSDHGMMSQPADGADVLDMELFPGVRLGQAGPSASLYVDEGGAERAAAVRDSIAATMPKNGVYLRADVPERLHYSADPRVGDIVIVAAEGRSVVTPDRVPDRDGFNHGWDNAFVSMGGIFLAQGPRIAGGQTIDVFESIHVYPFLASVLGLTPNVDVDGRLEVLQPILGN